MLQVRYHENFKSMARVVLLAGDVDDLRKVRLFFDSWNGEATDLLTALKQIQAVVGSGLKKLMIEVNKTQRTVSGNDGDEIFLSLSKEDKERIVGLLEGLENSDRPGHQYLRNKGQTIAVMFAKDEYPLEDGST